MKKGNIVLVKATAQTMYLPEFNCLSTTWPNSVEMVHQPYPEGARVKCLVKLTGPRQWQGICVGYSYRATGEYWDWDQDCPARLSEDKRHKVWMIQPLDTNRWLKPTACLEEDLEIDINA